VGEAELSLYEEIGGAAGVEDVVAGLYQRTMADDVLAPFFAGRSVDVIVAHQRELIAGALGGPSAYAGRSLRDAHAGMAIEPEHFHALTTHLVDALSACGVAPSATDRVTAVITRLWYAQQWPDGADDGSPAQI
jgi:hemoglobin